MSAQALLWGVCGTGAALAAVASLAERRRARRRAAHGPGFMPWSTLVFAGVLIALGAMVAALQAGS